MDNVEIKILSGIGSKEPAAILVQTESHHILLDAGGVLEENALMWQMPERVDAVFLSHDHFDHIGNVHNIPLDTPIYCSEITANALPDHDVRNIHILPIKGTFQLGNMTVTTGANGHAYGGMWFHLDCAGGIFFSGDVSLSSLLYHFDEPPHAKLALLDASYGLYDVEQTALRHSLKKALRPQTLLPVPPSGRAIEMAFWLLEEGITDIALDDECLQFLMTMMNYNDGSLQEGIAQKLEYLHSQLSEMSDEQLPNIILAGHPDGRQDESGRLRELPQFQHRTIFTGYCDAKAREEIERGEVDFYRWNVHPTVQELQKIVQILQCEIVVPLFFKINHLYAWENALNVKVLLNSHILIEPMSEPNFIEQSNFLERKVFV